MSTKQATPGAPRRPARPRTPARLLPPALAAAVLAGCVATATAQDASREGAGGTAPPASEPPTAAEVRAWEAEFLASEPAEKSSAAGAPKTGKAPGGPLFGQRKVLSLYGAAGGFGIIGRKSVNGAAAKLNKQVRPYRKRSKEPVVKAFDLVTVIATKCSGSNDLCRIRVSDSVIRRYLKKIREINGRLVLDIQPGRANVLDEMKHLKKFIQMPDVDVAIDAEWNVGPRGKPGEDLGSITAKQLNNASTKMRKIITNRGLGAKLLIVHQFREDSVKNRGGVRRPKEVDVTLNFDGIGGPSAKRAGYRNLSQKGLFNGFSLFYELDSNLMSPRAVLGLSPQVDYIMYQ